MSEWEITQYEESKHLGIKFESPRFQGTVAFDLEPSGDGTRLAFQMRGTPKGLVSKLLVPIFMPMARGSSVRTSTRSRKFSSPSSDVAGLTAEPGEPII